MRASYLDAGMAWMDALWDDDAALLWDVRRGYHMTRETAWYALGLLQTGRSERVERALRAVIAQQFDAGGAPYDGTFRRSPEEADPPDGPVMWIHYDPNWRQFIGTTFAVICDSYADVLSTDVVDAMRGSTQRAISSEAPDRVSPDYSNIALMKAWLDRDESFAQQVADLFFAHNTFLEYNSPTYYGIDLWALALWRATPGVFGELGSRITDALWRDIADFYHAGLRNMCGPYDRAYGTDMTAHATPLGLWMWSVVGDDLAPFPDTRTKFRHPHDFCMAPCVAAFDAHVPEDVIPHLEAFAGQRLLERTVTTQPSRTVTAWLDDDVMVGAWSGPASGIGFFQHQHGTVHWRRDDGGIGWVRLRSEVKARCVASPGRLEVELFAPADDLFAASEGCELGDAPVEIMVREV